MLKGDVADQERHGEAQTRRVPGGGAHDAVDAARAAVRRRRRADDEGTSSPRERRPRGMIIEGPTSDEPRVALRVNPRERVDVSDRHGVSDEQGVVRGQALGDGGRHRHLGDALANLRVGERSGRLPSARRVHRRERLPERDARGALGASEVGGGGRRSGDRRVVQLLLGETKHAPLEKVGDVGDGGGDVRRHAVARVDAISAPRHDDPLGAIGTQSRPLQTRLRALRRHARAELHDGVRRRERRDGLGAQHQVEAIDQAGTTPGTRGGRRRVFLAPPLAPAPHAQAARGVGDHRPPERRRDARRGERVRRVAAAGDDQEPAPS